MNKFIRLTLAGAAALTGLALFLVKTDRAFITNIPIEGETNAIILESERAYVQTFSAIASDVSQVSVFLRPVARQIAKGEITFSVTVAGEMFTQKVSAEFIDSQGSTQIRFTPPIITRPGNPVTITLQVPENLSGQIRAQVSESSEFAYLVYSTYTPPLVIPIGGLFTLAAFIALFPLHRWKWVPSPAVLLGVVIFSLVPWPLKLLTPPAALMLSALNRFLGQDQFVTALMYIIVILVLLELYHLEYGRY